MIVHTVYSTELPEKNTISLFILVFSMTMFVLYSVQDVCAVVSMAVLAVEQITPVVFLSTEIKSNSIFFGWII